MYIKRYTNRQGEELNAPIAKYANRFFFVDLYGTTHPNTEYDQFCNAPRTIHTFEYVVSGSGYIDCDDRHIKVTAGDFYYLRRGFAGHYYPDDTDPYKKIWVNIRSTMLDSTAEMFGITDTVTVCRCPDTEKLLRELHHELDECEGKELESVLCRCSEIAYSILSLVCCESSIKASLYRPGFSESIKRYIDDQITASPSIEELAQRFHVSEGYLIRRFKNETGITPMRYYNDSRINAAKKLLSEGHTAKSAAAMLKYSDAAYLCKCFKEKFGMSPSEFASAKKP